MSDETRDLKLTDDEIWALRNAVQNSIKAAGESDIAEESAYAKLVASQDA